MKSHPNIHRDALPAQQKTTVKLVDENKEGDEREKIDIDDIEVQSEKSNNEDDDDNNAETDRITLALLFTLTENLGLNVEYSHSDRESSDVDEFLVEGLLSF